MRFQFIKEHQTQYSVNLMCRLLEVSRSGYYAWLKRKPSKREMADREYSAMIEQIHAESDRVYGYAPIWEELREQGIPCGKHRVRRLMRRHGLEAKRVKQFKRTTQRDPRHAVAPNRLEQDFTATRPDEKWAGDITYIRTAEGWLYLAVVLDLFSRRIVGWSMSNRITRQLVIDALNMAITQRRPTAGTIHHSDRGCQYTSSEFGKLLARHQVVASMSGTGNCYDNAVVESFFSTLKLERVHHMRYRTRAEAETDIFFYIEAFYNRYRRHSTLGYVSPAVYEQRHAEASVLAGV